MCVCVRSVKEEVLKEVLGMLVSYKVVARVLAAGSVADGERERERMNEK